MLQQVMFEVYLIAAVGNGRGQAHHQHCLSSTLACLHVAALLSLKSHPKAQGFKRLKRLKRPKRLKRLV